MRSELGLGTNDIAIGVVANLIEYKGHAELVRGFHRVVDLFPSAKLFLVGEGPCEPSIRANAAEGHVAENVIFLGRRTDVPDILAAMDVGVLPSYEEGFSNALLEKLAAGLPIVATAVGGNPEALLDTPGCRLVQRFETPALAEAIIDVIGERERMGWARAARQETVRRRFSIDAMVSSYEDLYLASLLESRAALAPA